MRRNIEAQTRVNAAYRTAILDVLYDASPGALSNSEMNDRILGGSYEAEILHDIPEPYAPALLQLGLEGLITTFPTEGGLRTTLRGNATEEQAITFLERLEETKETNLLAIDPTDPTYWRVPTDKLVRFLQQRQADMNKQITSLTEAFGKSQQLPVVH